MWTATDSESSSDLSCATDFQIVFPVALPSVVWVRTDVTVVSQS